MIQNSLSCDHLWHEYIAVVICAEWCGVCREFRKIVKDHQDFHLTWMELDIFEEISSDLVVEIFPTVVVLHQSSVLFVGAIKPKNESLQSLIDASREYSPILKYEELGKNLWSQLIKDFY